MERSAQRDQTCDVTSPVVHCDKPQTVVETREGNVGIVLVSFVSVRNRFSQGGEGENEVVAEGEELDLRTEFGRCD